MPIRSVTVRYAANVTDLISGLDKAAKANDRLGDSSDKAGQRIDRNAKAAAGVALAVGVAVAKFAEFDSTMSQVAAATGATGDELASLRDTAVDAGQATKFSATEAAEGITELAKAGIDAKDIIGGGLTGALNLAAAGQQSVAESAETMASALSQFNLDGSKASHVADLLAAGAGKAQGSVSDMGQALNQTGQVASLTGLSIEETTAGLTAFASAGLTGSDAGTSFKSMLQRLTPQSAEASDLMDKLGISAYDAGGNFIGLESFAGNLKDSLKDLTPEQRNAALAVIFGSDAVRAASVLYDEGADGIRRWTDEVNQQGFAAKQAAALSDNLKGDIERLSGAFETNLIKAGSGANDSLRFLVQTGERLLDVIGSIPGPVLLGAAALATMSLAGPKLKQLGQTAGGPLTSGLSRFRQELALQRAMAPSVVSGWDRIGAGATALVRSTGGVKGALSGAMGLLGGPWGVALTGATLGITAFATAQSNAQAASDALTATLDAQSGAFTAATRETVVGAIQKDVDSLDLKSLEQVGVFLKDATDKAIEGGAGLDAYQAHLDDLAKQYPELAGNLNGLSNSIENQDEVLQDARVQWDLKSKAMADATAADKVAAAGAEVLKAGSDAVNQSLAQTSPAATGMAAALVKLGGASSDAKAELDLFQQALDLMSGGERAMRAANDGLADSLDALGAAAAAKADKTTTAAQVERNYRSALDDVAVSMNTVIGVQAKNNASTAQLSETYDLNRAAVIKSLKAHGVHASQLEAEADSIVGTRGEFSLLLAEYARNPSRVAATVEARGTDTAKSKVQGVWNVINGQPKFIPVTIQVSVFQNVTRSVNEIVNSVSGIARGLFSARGNIVKPYAAGGFNFDGDVANGHLPGIFGPSSFVRAFAEPETGGELYAPLANDWRRPRAKTLVADTVRRFGGDVTWNAVGSVTGGPRGAGSTTHIDYARLAAAIRSQPISLEASLSIDGRQAGALVAAGNRSNLRGGASR